MMKNTPYTTTPESFTGSPVEITPHTWEQILRISERLNQSPEDVLSVAIERYENDLTDQSD
jgi:hypothetical protein